MLTLSPCQILEVNEGLSIQPGAMTNDNATDHSLCRDWPQSFPHLWADQLVDQGGR
jgi:hypothetical protein